MLLLFRWVVVHDKTSCLLYKSESVIIYSCDYLLTAGVVAIAYASDIPCMVKELEYDSDHTDDKEEEAHKDVAEGGNGEQETIESKQWLQATKKDKEKETDAQKFRKFFLKPRKPETGKVNYTEIRIHIVFICC